MAQRAIREFDGKRLLDKYLGQYLTEETKPYRGILVTEANFSKLKLPKWAAGYVVKPDQLFGKRGKNNLVFISKDEQEIKAWIKQRLNKPAKVIRSKDDPGITDKLTHFLIEPFVEHETEYYLAFKTEPEYDLLMVSKEGGIDVEENWDKVTEIKIPFSYEPIPLAKAVRDEIEKALGSRNNNLIDYISGLHQVFRQLDFSYLEINPLAVNSDGVHMLDLVARLDDTAQYKNMHEWNFDGELIFPAQFGASDTTAERIVRQLDAKTGASLKLSIINPNGSIWLLLSGGGASVILTDTAGDLGFENEIANYGEYSGNPSTDETAAYSDALLEQMFQSNAKQKTLVIAGGIANFTDVKNTFYGIVQSIRKNKAKFIKEKIKIYIRRGGPNYQKGLKYIEEEVKAMDIPIEVYGPEMYMTEVIKKALTEK